MTLKELKHKHPELYLEIYLRGVWAAFRHVCREERAGKTLRFRGGLNPKP